MIEKEIIKAVRFSPDEMRVVQEKMRQLGTSNFSAFMRKMAIDGYVVRLELPELKELVSLLRSTKVEESTMPTLRTFTRIRNACGGRPNKFWTNCPSCNLLPYPCVVLTLSI